MDALFNCSDFAVTCLCSGSHVGSFFLFAWFVSYMLLVPVFLSVLYLGYKRWKKHPHSAVSHSDVFTFHLIGKEMLTALGSVLFMYGLFAGVSDILKLGTSLWSFAFNGQLVFHLLTCVERYLAVVHPITYLCLKKRGGVYIRNASIGFVWMFSVCNSLFILYSFRLENLIHLLLAILSLGLMSFCSVSVLCVLIRPGPGDRSVTKTQLNHSKKSAFYTIMAIMAVLVVRLLNALVLQSLSLFTAVDSCLLTTSKLWFSFPSSLVLPVLFLHRARIRQQSKK